MIFSRRINVLMVCSGSLKMIEFLLYQIVLITTSMTRKTLQTKVAALATADLSPGLRLSFDGSRICIQSKEYHPLSEKTRKVAHLMLEGQSNFNHHASHLSYLCRICPIDFALPFHLLLD